MSKSSERGVFHSENVSVFLAELFGTALLVFLGCSGCIGWGEGKAELHIVLGFGIAVLICVQIFGCVSGAHINPAVTVAALIYKLVSVQKACAYVIAQCLGGFIGYGLLEPKAVCVEFIATATLIWFCCGIWDPRNARHHDSVAIRFGLAVAGLATAVGGWSGGSFNPARSLSPAIWTMDFESQWVYWVGPLSGAAVASTIYKYVFYREIIETEDRGIDLQNIG